MKKQEIRSIYSQKVAELLNQGYTIFPDTMNGSQGEIAHVDLTNGSEILRVLLDRGHKYSTHNDEDYWGDTVTLIVGVAHEDSRIWHWDGTIWNNRLTSRFQIEWAEISHEWYTDMEEGRRIEKLRLERYHAQDRKIREELDGAFKSVALRWLRKQPRMKSCRLEDIQRMERFWDNKGHRHFEIRAKGKTFIIG